MTAKVGLVEVFSAPQGEGYNAGRWAVFVRLAGCPLACEFAPGVVCDTPYMQATLKVTVEELFEVVIPREIAHYHQQFFGKGREQLPMLIFTGGEPTASPQFNNLIAYASQHTDPRFYIAVETNGTTWRSATTARKGKSASSSTGRSTP